jgi:hypothetical protein
MARRKRSSTGEHVTVKRTVWLTPSTADQLTEGAAKAGLSFASFARELLEARSPAAAAARSTRSSPEVAALKREIEAAGRQEYAIGNNLNQIARHLNTTGDLREWIDLHEAIAIYKRAAERHIEALEHVMTL